MASDRKLPVATGHLEILQARLDVNQTIRTTADMTPAAAAAYVEIAKQTYAVPAQEETKRAKQETGRVGIVGACFLAACGVMLLSKELAWPVAAAIGVLAGSVVAPEVVRQWKKLSGGK